MYINICRRSCATEFILCFLVLFDVLSLNKTTHRYYCKRSTTSQTDDDNHANRVRIVYSPSLSLSAWQHMIPACTAVWCTCRVYTFMLPSADAAARFNRIVLVLHTSVCISHVGHNAAAPCAPLLCETCCVYIRCILYVARTCNSTPPIYHILIYIYISYFSPDSLCVAALPVSKECT